MSADSPPRGGPPAAPPQSPISAITSEIAMHLGRADSLLASASPSKSGNPGRHHIQIEMLQCRQKSGTAILDKNDGSLLRFDLKPLPDFLNVTDHTVEE